MTPLLLLLAFLLPLRMEKEIIWGQEGKPHSHPYMAFVQFLDGEKMKRCGGVLVQKRFVLTAAYCKVSSISVILGAHNIQKQEKTQQEDSGLPLVCNHMIQVIFCHAKNDGNLPGIFMKVSHFLPWIKKTMEQF
nr:granzyme H-like [Cavia porcellus]